MTQLTDTETFYLKLIRETAEGIQQKVCAACNIPLTPTSTDQCRPIPVYEENEQLSLLAVANERNPTEIKWVTNQSNDYLPAYFKRYRHPVTRRIRNEIVITANNYCSARFFAAKELMHCFLDEDGITSTNSHKLVHDLLDDLVAGGTLTRRPSPQTTVDEIAWAGAVHYLLPDSWTPALKQAIVAVQAQEPTANAYHHLAQLVRVPENVLRLKLRHSE